MGDTFEVESVAATVTSKSYGLAIREYSSASMHFQTHDDLEACQFLYSANHSTLFNVSYIISHDP